MYFSWGVSVVFAFIIFFMARTAVRVLLFDFVLNEWISQAVATLIEKVLVVIVGLVILSFIVLVQDYFYKALGKNILLKRILRILGIELLIIFAFNAFIAIPKCFSPEGINLLLLIGFELLSAIILIVSSFRSSEVKVYKE